MGYILSGAVLELALVPDAASLEGEGNTLRHGGSEMGLLNVGHVGSWYVCEVQKCEAGWRLWRRG